VTDVDCGAVFFRCSDFVRMVKRFCVEISTLRRRWRRSETAVRLRKVAGGERVELVDLELVEMAEGDMRTALCVALSASADEEARKGKLQALGAVLIAASDGCRSLGCESSE
jgi:hypothetical protein